jgi:hypothetical protein
MSLLGGNYDFVLFFSGIEVCTQGFMLAKKVFYHLSYACSPFGSGYFGDGGS